MTIKIGQTTTDRSLLGRRDAFHAPAILTQCKDIIRPCDNVKFINATTVEKCDLKDRHGIVDPFINSPNMFNCFFWVLLTPDSTSNLTHWFDTSFLPNNMNGVETILKDEIQKLEKEVDRLKQVEERFEGYDDDDSGCRGCY